MINNSNSTTVHGKKNQTIVFLSQTNEHKYRRPQHMTLEIQVLARDRHKNVVGLNLLMGSFTSIHSKGARVAQ